MTLPLAAPSALTRLSIERSKLFFLAFASHSPFTREFIAPSTPSLLYERGEGAVVTDADNFVDDHILESDQTRNRFLRPVPVFPELKGDLRDAPRTLVDWASLQVFPRCAFWSTGQ